MTNSTNRLNALRGGFTAGKSLSQQELEREEHESSQPSVLLQITLNRIRMRQRNTRKITLSHVKNLLDSIQALGLIEPLVVDKKFRLLAGAHRLQALMTFQNEQPSLFLEQFPQGLIPVRQFDFDAETDLNNALAIEVAENAQRKNYTTMEFNDVAQRLIDAGYTETVGRPKNGEKSLGHALTVVLGCTTRTVRRRLRAFRTPEKMVTDVTINSNAAAQIYIDKFRRSLTRHIAYFSSLTPSIPDVVQDLQRVDEALSKYHL
jgi:ParB family chromosome partitioning protein